MAKPVCGTRKKRSSQLKKMWKIKKIRADKLAVIEELTVTFSIQSCEKVMFHDFFARLIIF